MKKIFEFLFLLALLIILIYLGQTKLLPAFFYNRGRNYYDRGLYDEAIVSFKKSLKINPNIAVVHCSLANAYMETKLEDKATEEYQKTIQLDPKNTYAYRSLSYIYSNRRMYEEALNQLKQAEIMTPSDQEINKLQEAISLEYMADCLDRGAGLFLAGDKPKAYALLNKALEIKPDFAFAHYTLAYFYFMEHNYDAAERSLNQAIKIDSQFWPAYKLLGDIDFEKRLYEKAIDEYKTALKIDYKNPSLYHGLGLALMKLERYKEALVYLKNASELQPDNLDYCYSLASTYRDNGMFQGAILEYQKVLSRQPDYPHIHNDLGDIYLNQGKVQEALEEFRKEIAHCNSNLKQNPNNPVMLNNLAYALAGVGDYNRAKEVIDKVIASQPNYRQAHLTLAKIYEKLGNSKEALAALTKAKSLSIQANFIDRDIAKLKEELKPSFDTAFLPIDTVYLKNGRQIKGRIKEEDEEKVILEIKLGNVIGNATFYRDLIERVEKIGANIK